MKTKLTSILLFSALLLASPIIAQTTIEYSDGDVNNTAYFSTSDGLLLTIESGSATQSGAIADGDGAPIIKMGAGELTLSDANTFTGETRVTGGNLKVALGGSITGTSSVIIGDSIPYAGTFEVDGENGGAFVTTEELLVGRDSHGAMRVLNGGRVSAGLTSIGVSGTGMGEIQISSQGSLLSVGSLYVGQFGTGSVRVETGGRLESRAEAGIGAVPGSEGAVTVTGTDSSWKSVGNLMVGGHGKGTLNILDGGLVKGDSQIVTDYEGNVNVSTDGTVTVSGNNSLWSVEGFFSVGGEGNGGVVNLLDGGQVSVGYGDIGTFENQKGIVKVDGAGSVFGMTAGKLGIGYEGDGTLNLSNRGSLDYSSIPSALVLGVDAIGKGTLNIGADPTLPGEPVGAGLVNAIGIEGGAGDATLNFNHTDTDYYFTNNGLAGGSAVAITGSVKVEHYAGTTTLVGTPGSHTYTGGTTIRGGTLIGDTDSLQGNIVNNAQLIFDQSSDGIYERGVISGTGDLSKTGAGTLTLLEQFTYTGATHVNEGTLVVNDSLGDTLVTVGDGATLGGRGSFGGLTTIEFGGTLSPGNSPDMITFLDGLTLSDGSALDFELGTISDKIIVSGGILTGSTSAEGITLNISDSGGFGVGTYTLIDFTGTTLSDFDLTDFIFDSKIGGYDYTLGFNGNKLELLAAIPEPATTALLAGGAILLAAVSFRRRKQQQA